MASYLSDIEPFEVTLCKNPAVGEYAKFVLTKAQEEEGFSPLSFRTLFQKTDSEKKQVFGYVLVPDREDLQGDIVTKEEVEKACHNFLKNLSGHNQKGSGTGLEHIEFQGIGYPIESFYDEQGIHGVAGGWFLGTQITNEDVWQRVKKGELTGYSVGGMGQREEVSKTEASEESALAKFTEMLAKATSAIKDTLVALNNSKEESIVKGGKEMKEELEKQEETLEEVAKEEVTKEEATKEEPAVVEKESGGEEEEVDKEAPMCEHDHKAELMERLIAIEERLSALEAFKSELAKEVSCEDKEVAKAEEEEKETFAKEATLEELKSAIKTGMEEMSKSLKALEERVEVVENTSQGSTAIMGQEVEVEKKSEDVFASLFNF